MLLRYNAENYFFSGNCTVFTEYLEYPDATSLCKGLLRHCVRDCYATVAGIVTPLCKGLLLHCVRDCYATVFQTMHPLNFSKFDPYLIVFIPGSWTRSFIPRLLLLGLCSKRSH